MFTLTITGEKITYLSLAKTHMPSVVIDGFKQVICFNRRLRMPILVFMMKWKVDAIGTWPLCAINGISIWLITYVLLHWKFLNIPKVYAFIDINTGWFLIKTIFLNSNNWDNWYTHILILQECLKTFLRGNIIWNHLLDC